MKAERIVELWGKFPSLPRSIVTKMDVLREGVRYTAELEEAGAQSLPFFLLWNPVHAENPAVREERFLMIPWKFQFADGVPVKIVLNDCSPYSVRKRGEDGYLLCYGVARWQHSPPCARGKAALPSSRCAARLGECAE